MSRIVGKINKLFTRIFRGCLFIYPLVVHIAILVNHSVWAAAYLLVSVGSYVALILSQTYLFASVVFIAFTGFFLFLLLSAESSTWIIYLPPILIPAWLAFLFLKSLLDEFPVISKIALKIEGGNLSEQHLIYTKWLTAIWGIVFILMIIEAISLATMSSFRTWSWWVHIGNYLIIATMFILEMMIRPLATGQGVQFKKMFKAIMKQNWHE